jgi:hypothetical protein
VKQTRPQITQLAKSHEISVLLRCIVSTSSPEGTVTPAEQLTPQCSIIDFALIFIILSFTLATINAYAPLSGSRDIQSWCWRLRAALAVFGALPLSFHV